MAQRLVARWWAVAARRGYARAGPPPPRPNAPARASPGKQSRTAETEQQVVPRDANPVAETGELESQRPQIVFEPDPPQYEGKDNATLKITRMLFMLLATNTAIGLWYFNTTEPDSQGLVRARSDAELPPAAWQRSAAERQAQLDHQPKPQQ